MHFESAADLAGRTGLGFWRIDGYLKQELVIDPVTYIFMGFEDVAVADHALVGTDGTPARRRRTSSGQFLPCLASPGPDR